METGTIHLEHRSRLKPRVKRNSTLRDFLHQATTVNGDAQIHLVPAEIRETATNLREQLLCNLRAEGYTFDEIGQLFGVTRQRASQIERKMVRRARLRFLEQITHTVPKPQRNSIRDTHHTWVRQITREEFESRLESINRSFEIRFDRIVKRRYKRPGFLDSSSVSSEITGFWKVWPLIELYQKRPFTFSKLVADFPQLSKQSYLAQSLCGLRRKALLRRVGLVRVEGVNRPQVLMAEAPIEQQMAATIERLVASWSRKLQRFQSAYRPTRSTRSIELTRQCLLERLIGEGVPSDEIERVLGRGRGHRNRCVNKIRRRGASN